MLFGPPRTLVLTFDGDKAFRVVTPEGTRYFPVEDTYGSVALSLDGRTLAHSSYREFYVWDVDKGAPIKSYPAPPDRATDVTFGPVGGEMRVWSRDFDVLSMSVAAPGAPEWKELFRMERKDLRGLRPSGYGRYAAIASDKKVFVLDASNGALHSAQEDTTLRLDRFAVSADGTALFLSREKRIDRFDMASGKALGTTSVPGCTLSTLASSFDGSRVLAQCWEHSYLFSYAPGSDPPTTTNVDLGRTAYDKTALAPHGDLIVTGQDDGSLRVRDTGAALRMEIFPPPGRGRDAVPIAGRARAALRQGRRQNRRAPLLPGGAARRPLRRLRGRAHRRRPPGRRLRARLPLIARIGLVSRLFERSGPRSPGTPRHAAEQGALPAWMGTKIKKVR